VVVIFCHESLRALSRLEICKTLPSEQRELLLTMEAVGTGLLLGTSNGRVVELQVQPSGSCDAALLTLHPGGSMICDMGSLKAQLAVSASVSGEIRVWKRGSLGKGKRRGVSSSSSSAYHSAKATADTPWHMLRKVDWPGPTLPSDSHRCKREECEKMMKTPTLTVCLVPRGSLLAMSASSASQLFVYSFSEDAIIHQVELPSSLLPVVRLRVVPQEEAKSDDSALLLLSEGNFAVAQLFGSAGRGLQISQEHQIPGNSSLVRGRCDAALLPKADGHYQAWIKSEAAISCWDMTF